METGLKHANTDRSPISVSTCDSKELFKTKTEQVGKEKRLFTSSSFVCASTCGASKKCGFDKIMQRQDRDQNYIRDAASATATQLKRSLLKGSRIRSRPQTCFTKRVLHERIQSLKTRCQIFPLVNPVKFSYCILRLHNNSVESNATDNPPLSSRSTRTVVVQRSA